jgi:hypothetical protein
MLIRALSSNFKIYFKIFSSENKSKPSKNKSKPSNGFNFLKLNKNQKYFRIFENVQTYFELKK